VDNNGLSPLHVAIKKTQIKAVEYALNHNLKKGEEGHASDLFDFNCPGKTCFTPLHYAVFKQNHDAFLYLVRHCHSQLNLFAVDESFRTPRGLALINSPFFKILVRLEKMLILHTEETNHHKNYQGVTGMHVLQASRKNIRNQGRGVPNFKSHDFSQASNFLSFGSSKALHTFRGSHT
jgi:hypothetical protein